MKKRRNCTERAQKGPTRCPGCNDRRIAAYCHNITCWEPPYEVLVWQCYGCGALLEVQTNHTKIVGYDRVILPHGMKQAPKSYVAKEQ